MLNSKEIKRNYKGGEKIQDIRLIMFMLEV
jgi:hypothetical protein